MSEFPEVKRYFPRSPCELWDWVKYRLEGFRQAGDTSIHPNILPAELV